MIVVNRFSDICPDTLKKWADTYKEFAFVFELGDAMHEAWYIREGKANLKNSRFQTPLFKHLTGNKLGYAEKVETTNTNNNTSVGVLLVPGQMSIEDWEQKNVDDDIIDAEVTNVQETG